MLLEVIPKGITLLVLIYMNTHECVAGSSTCEKQREHPRWNFGTDLDPSKLGQDGYGWLYLAVWLFSVVVSFVNLLLSFTERDVQQQNLA